MKVRFTANVCDQTTSHVAKAIHLPFKELGCLLEGDYGGLMEHLWIDLELLESRIKADAKSTHSFRFQKRVSGYSRMGLSAISDSYNVGHYSVKPDFYKITTLQNVALICYVVNLIYESTTVLIEKQKRLGGFNATLFRENFVQASRSLGYEVISDVL